MDKRLLERIIIIILLLLNLFLLMIVLSDKLQVRRSERETLESVAALLAEKGIAVSDSVLTVQNAPPVCTVVRDGGAETEKVTRLLGKHTQENLGGNILFYRSDRGQAVFRGNGEVDVLLSGNEAAVRAAREKTVERMMRKIGVEVLRRESGTQEDNAPEYYCCWNGSPVFNAILSFDFNERSLYMISGVRTFDTETAQSGEGLLNSVSVLTRFAEIREEQGLICSRLESLRPGYLMSVTVSGESVLSPVWCVETDTGSMLINAETGRAENVSP